MKNKKNILIAILVIVLIIIAVFFINTFRKFGIIKELQKNLGQRNLSKSYHVKHITDMKDGKKVVTNRYKKNGNELTTTKVEYDDGKSYKMSTYTKGENVSIYTEKDDKKTLELAKDYKVKSEKIGNCYIEAEGSWEMFLRCMSLKVQKTDYEGKVCYIISDNKGKEINEGYVEKDTGLLIKQNDNGIVTKYEYELNNVQDEIFIEPDSSQYEKI